jgi:hypothetical protein
VQEERCCEPGICLTLPLRIIAAVVLYALIIAAFGVVIVLTLFAIMGRSKRKNSDRPNPDNRAID